MRSGTSAGPLGAGEWERVRLHPHFTERMLQQSATLAPLGRIAVQHRERLDGSGYPRGLSGTCNLRGRLASSAPPTPTRPCASPARTARRTHQQAPPPNCARRYARDDSLPTRSKRCSPPPVTVSLRRIEGPAGLTAREVEVLRLVASGLTNKEIATRLVITPKTAGNHVEHIYTKIGTSNRASASLFAMQHGLLPEDRFPTVD